MKRFVVIALSGFGIGATDDAVTACPRDEKTNTPRSILGSHPGMKFPNLERLGLMNVYGAGSSRMKVWEGTSFGRSKLMHLGADTLVGHQEVMGAFPRKLNAHPFRKRVDTVAGHLREQGHRVETIEREGLRYVFCGDLVTMADNLEANPGMCYNVTAPLDYIPSEKEYEIGHLIREVVTVGRVIVFDGIGNPVEDLWNAEETRDHAFIGIASAKSRSYEQGCQCLHLGYEVDKNVQTPTILTGAGIPTTLVGKVTDIVADDKGTSISCMSTEACMEHAVHAFRHMEIGFIYTNVQETDLAGRSQPSPVYRQILKTADRGIGELFPLLTEEDVLLAIADHGNDPGIGHSKHTRECVPLLVYREGVIGKGLGIRKSLSGVGVSVCDYFGVKASRNDISFMGCLKDQKRIDRKRSLPLVFNYSILLTML